MRMREAFPSLAFLVQIAPRERIYPDRSYRRGSTRHDL